MITGENIICISSIDWDFVWQGHQEVMLTLAKAGNRVLFIENTGVRPPSLKDIPRVAKRFTDWKESRTTEKKAHGNLYIYSPLALPFPYSESARPLNKILLTDKIIRWMNEKNFTKPIIWTFLPTNVSIDLIDAVKDRKMVVYYCIAEFSELVRHPEKFRKKEKELLERSDLVFAQGEKIKERCARFNKNVHIFPFGVNNKVFLERSGAENIPEDIKRIPRPVIGYIGGIHKHVDTGLLKYTASVKKDWSIVLVGPMQVKDDTFKENPNIYLLGKKEHKGLPGYVANFDACIIPYLLNEYTETVYPTKLNEYLIMGKPVIATSIPEVDKFDAENRNVIEVTKTKESFVAKIEEALRKKDTPEIKQERINVALKSDWPSRIEKMSSHMEAVLEKKHL